MGCANRKYLVHMDTGHEFILGDLRIVNYSTLLYSSYIEVEEYDTLSSNIYLYLYLYTS
jgi:hypothetical protein